MDLTVKVSADCWDETNIEDRIFDAIAHKMVGKIGDAMNKRMDDLIDRTASEIIKARIEDSVATIMEAGWFETDSYGQRSGSRVTLNDRINQALSTRDPYNKSSIIKCVDGAIQKRFDSEMADGVKRLKAKIDEVINSTIDETITGEIKTKIRAALARG